MSPGHRTVSGTASLPARVRHPPHSHRMTACLQTAVPSSRRHASAQNPQVALHAPRREPRPYREQGLSQRGPSPPQLQAPCPSAPHSQLVNISPVTLASTLFLRRARQLLPRAVRPPSSAGLPFPHSCTASPAALSWRLKPTLQGHHHLQPQLEPPPSLW